MAGLGSRVFLIKVVQDVTHTQTVAADFIRISGADALACGSHLGVSLGCLVSGIQQAVGRQNEVGLLGDVQTFFQVVAGSLQCFGLGFEQSRVQYHPVTDDVYLIALEYAGRDGAEHVFLSFKLQRMPGIGASLKAGHDIVSRGQDIDDLAFAFVAPL